MVIEHFHAGALPRVYERFAQQGRTLPAGLLYLDSWLSADGTRCFQLMETEDFSLFAQWTPHWQDLTDFEIIELGDKPTARAAPTGESARPEDTDDNTPKGDRRWS